MLTTAKLTDIFLKINKSTPFTQNIKKENVSQFKNLLKNNSKNFEKH